MTIRTRIAPSPTGYLHIGTARTALFNYLFAKKNGGTFVLRIEDTDVERSTPEFEKDILEGLRWLGIQWDEGPDCGGPFGPYRQRERLDLYKKYLLDLDSKGHLYRCYCTKEELEREREIQILAKQPPRYSGKCSTLSELERLGQEGEGRASTLRFRIQKKSLRVHDLVRGDIDFDTSLLDDFVIAKDFDTPLYNFAVVIDDYLMEISHVIRGEDHISNTPKQILLAEALSFPIPQFAHLSMILNADRTKLSKRQNKVSLLEYKNDGYLPHALINFMVLLGWNPGGERELYRLDELGQLFDLSAVNKSGAVFDTVKLDWFNSHYIRELSRSKLTQACIPFLTAAGKITLNDTGLIINNTGQVRDLSWLEAVVGTEQARMKKLSEIVESASYFFEDVLSYDHTLLSWKDMTAEQTQESLAFSVSVLEQISDQSFTAEIIEKELKGAVVAKEMKNGFVLWPLRVALTGKQASPSPFEVAAVLGKIHTVSRLNDAQKILKGPLQK